MKIHVHVLQVYRNMSKQPTMHMLQIKMDFHCFLFSNKMFCI